MDQLIRFSIISFFLLGFSVLTGAQSDPATYLYHICSNTTAFTPNSTYQSNRNLLFTALTSNASRPIGFYSVSTGRDPDDVYGSFLCRGDVSPDACRSCVTLATQETVERCPIEKKVIVWYDQCLLRYDNQSFFSRNDESPVVYLWNTQNVSGTDPGRFNTLLAGDMRAAATAAAGAPSGAKKFAVREANISAFQTLYSLVQCTPDLSTSDCSLCIQAAISQLPSCCNGKQGGRVLSPSCNIRYEIYSFYNSTALKPPPLPPSPPPPILPPPPPSPETEGKGGISTVVIVAIVVPIVVFLVLFCLGCCFLKRRAKKKYDVVQEDDVGNDITTAESLQIDLNKIESATNNFSADNKLGEGGFGTVYKGVFPNGQEIAVKKLSKNSGQGGEEFKNEVVLLAKLQHRNLVRLKGFCLEGEEKILIYEFVPNKSLDYFLFDPEKNLQLDWSRRYKIVGGIARGILYLHEDSRLKIIHRDLKVSNILLDKDMNPKISDFGMARIFVVDQTQASTNRIVGTYGYMSPEYAMHGQFSVKSDMYSFGVLVLEIVCGKKNSSFYQVEGANDLVSYVWKHWRDGTPMEVLDPTLKDSYSRNEVLRCIQIGLLCVQEDPADRPTMATVVLMLNSFSVTLPVPQHPAFFLHSRTDPTMPMKGLELDKSNSESTTKSMTTSVQLSVDEDSITQVLLDFS
ncbi:cysteine-rich receptor-like protein kinase 10 [Mercurialis annua]|uniref:cysteine-rich receptor-like protein kinase 10 n=1 Tax=Mercurialis annua TaxID=3986 RepID=UPI00215E5317|nr:cysteine-rich receptor-like protein kinase 10 [Mercurialis annua]